MGFWGFIAVVIILTIILRLLHSFFVWMDYVAGAVIIIFSIAMWINSGFWIALLSFFGTSMVVSFLFGLGSRTEWRNENARYYITCHKCGYGKMKIIDKDEEGVYARCERCGDARRYNY